MSIDFLHLLSYARPPLVGAFTGYVTTDIAIRLLFHPVRPWHVFGVRVPLTPGVLPSKRYLFGEKVGIMVGSHLFTSDDVREAVQKKEFRRELKGAIEERIDRLFALELGTLESLFPAEFQKWVRDLVGRLRQRGVEELFAFLDSQGCEQEVERLLSEMGDHLLSRDLHTLISAERHDELRARLAQTVTTFLHSREVRETLASIIDRKSDEFFASKAPVGSLLPRGSAPAIAGYLEKELQQGLQRLTSSAEFRFHLSRKIREALTGAVGSIQGVPGFLARFLDPEWLLSKFPNFTDKVEQEISVWLQDENTQRQLASALKERVERFLTQPRSALLGNLSYRRIAALRRLVRMKALKLLTSAQVADSVTHALGENLDRLGERTLGNLLTDLLSEQGVARVREEIGKEVLAALRSPSSREMLENALSEKVEELLFRRPIGHVSAFIPAHAREELVEGAFEQIADLLVKELPPLVDTLNIRRIVEEKVNGLDIVEMEGLLLEIMKESFMFLNLFSGFLGFLIGAISLVLPD